MSVFGDSVAAHREAFVDDLCARGFRLLTDRRTLVGDIDVEGEPVEHQIVLTDDFPITKPVVSTPGGEGGLSWHRESNGRFCLWSDDDAADLPWSSGDAVIDRIMQWHVNDAAGWPDDQRDLDLERYWPSIDELVIYPDLAPLTGEPCKAKRGSHGVWEIAQGKAPPRKPRWAGAAVVDVGELNEPVRSFDDLAEVLGSGEGRDAATSDRKGPAQVPDGALQAPRVRSRACAHRQGQGHQSPVRGRFRSRWRTDLPSAGGPGRRSPPCDIRSDRRGRSRRIPPC